MGSHHDPGPVISLDAHRAEQVRATHRAQAFAFADARSAALNALIAKTAPSNATVLITGETGTGKEVVARHIHRLSRRAHRPFHAVNCAAFADSLLEAELFGHERGAFTDAQAARAGWFEVADGATLFLDEVGELSTAMQVKLLRVIQEREVTRIGARRPVRCDVRLIAATNADLEAAVAAGRFREDLYFRLNVVSLALPPLRERPGDILALAEHFLRLHAPQGAVPEFDEGARAALLAHGWPGNIRELDNVVQRAVLTGQGLQITRADLDLPLPPMAAALKTVEHVPAPFAEDTTAAALPAALHEGVRISIEQGVPDLLRQVIELTLSEAFARAQGNQMRTAELLGVSRNVARTYLRNAGLIGPAAP